MKHKTNKCCQLVFFSWYQNAQLSNGHTDFFLVYSAVVANDNLSIINIKQSEIQKKRNVFIIYLIGELLSWKCFF